MRWILAFDRAKEESAIFDAAAVPAFESFMSAFKGLRLVSEDPITIEYYTDLWNLDAETNFGTGLIWPSYTQGEGAWHTVGMGVMAEAAGLATFSSAKAQELGVEWMSFVAGPTLQSLTDQLTASVDAATIPYAATLGTYVTADEAAARYANLQEFFRRRGHYWVGTGPFFMQRAFPVEGTVILERYPEFPDPADKWAALSAPAIAEVEVSGPGQVTIGDEAVFDVFVEFQGEPYAVADLKQVQYLLFDATGALVEQGEATAVEDGLWQVTLSADTTEALEAGSNRLEVVTVSNLVALPSVGSFEFVTSQ
jgi:peptide/nickel transport system substrate-binding protein